MTRPKSHRFKLSSLPFWMLVIFLGVLWMAGGSSRADVVGQVVTRTVAWIMLVIYILAGPPIVWARMRPVAIILGLCIFLVVCHLVPLPPAIWSSLPGREILLPAATLAGLPQPWRPLSISPSATINALNSLVVPCVTLVLAAALSREQHRRIASLLLALVVGGCLIGLVQLSGSRFDNLLINEMQGYVSGNFANRNHLALFVAIGCVLALEWGTRDTPWNRWKALASLAMLTIFFMIILTTGSRTGLIVGLVAIGAAAAIVRKQAMHEIKRLPSSIVLAVGAGMAAMVATAMILAIKFGRAEAIDRLALNAGEDLRVKAVPVVIGMIGDYFPAGSGMGTFDPAYRISEPIALLRSTYFNHAHNDWLEVALDGGLPGILLMMAAVGWWLRASVEAWRTHQPNGALARPATAICLLVMAASITDYPARTPMIMATLVLAAMWMSDKSTSADSKRGARVRSGNELAQTAPSQKGGLPDHLRHL